MLINRLACLAILLFIKTLNTDGASELKNWRSSGALKDSKSFLFYKTSSRLSELKCNCPNAFMCDCCQTVTLMQSLAQKNLCANFRYQKNGLVTEISMDSMILKTGIITTYRPYRMCTRVPGAMFSSVCLNILELNAFPRSLTVCPRLEIMSHSQEWKLTYTCLGISTELPSTLDQSTMVVSGAAIITPTEGHLLILPVSSGPQTVKPAGQMTTLMPQKIPSTMMTPSGGMTTTEVPSPMSQQTTAMPQGTKPANGTAPPAGQGSTTPMAQKPPTASTPPQNSTMPINRPTQSRHSSSFIQIDDKIETIILHSPESDDRSKFFPSRLPPAFEESAGLLNKTI